MATTAPGMTELQVEAYEVLDRLHDYVLALAWSSGKLSTRASYRRFDLLKAIKAFAPDVDEALDEMMSTLNIDEDGNPLSETGEPLASFDPGRVHPNDGAQAKGWSA